VSKLGGHPVEAKSKYSFPVEKLKSQADVLRLAAQLEQGAVSAYFGAVPAFDNRDLSRAAASILGDEAMHWAILRNALGVDPVPAAFVGQVRRPAIHGSGSGSCLMANRVGQEFVESVHRIGGVHERGAAAHIDRDRQCFHDVIAGATQAGQRLGVKTDATIAVSGHADGEGDKFLLLDCQRSGLHGAPGEGAEAGHRIGSAFLELGNAFVDVGRYLGVGLHMLLLWTMDSV